MRSTFDLADAIGLAANGAYFDLHNDFRFVGYEYRPAERTARFDWRRMDAEWVADGLPARLSLIFEGVSNFAVKCRNEGMPFSEDDCIATVSFLPRDFAGEFDAVLQGFRSDDEHMGLSFQSGAGVKVWAEAVRHEV